ncbi:hypothetical protein DFQ28_009637 [Apophysomyces sp. BC1034]|nr:hypothetical protein DFQ29_008352 [Apophysomyces sp. BC1021]KAG0185258.1 hypothetical protein DFQ28_009637 [Apophysomyces sp. BC1034]
MTAEVSHTKPPVFEESSQYRHWRFSSSQLWNTRQTSNSTAVERLKNNAGEGSEATTLQYLSVQDEMSLCRFYEKQLQGICKHLKFSDLVMVDLGGLTCLFLATKSESERISIDDFGKNLRLPSTSGVLDLEYSVSQGLKFEYYVYHPYRPAYGFFLDMQAKADIKLLKETYAKVDQVIAEILLTDLPLIYQPSQLALAAFTIAGKENGFEAHVRMYIEEKFPRHADVLLRIIHEASEILKKSTPVALEVAKEIDRRLNLCMNPAKNPSSAL